MRMGHNFLLLAILTSLCLWQPSAAAQRREYLNDDEVDKVRDTQEPNERAKLFLKFASNRLQSFQQALANPPQDQSKRSEYRENLNDLLAAFSACVDDAADALQIGHEHGADVMKGAAEMTRQAESYLKTLDELRKNQSPEYSAYEATVDDAMEGMRDALNDAKKIVAEQAARTAKGGRKSKP